MTQIQGSSYYWSPLHFQRAMGAVETAGPDGNQVIGRLRRLLLDDFHRPLERLRRPHSFHSLDDGRSHILSQTGNLENSNHNFYVTPAVARLAGTSGSADGTSGARFNLPYGSWSPDGENLFVIGHGNKTIRKVVIATGAVTTVAGLVGNAGTASGVGTVARF